MLADDSSNSSHGTTSTFQSFTIALSMLVRFKHLLLISLKRVRALQAREGGIHRRIHILDVTWRLCLTRFDMFVARRSCCRPKTPPQLSGHFSCRHQPRRDRDHDRYRGWSNVVRRPRRRSPGRVPHGGPRVPAQHELRPAAGLPYAEYEDRVRQLPELWPDALRLAGGHRPNTD